jgi:hypothetical protein
MCEKLRCGMQVLEKAGPEALPLEADRQHLRAAALARAGDLPGAAEVYRALVLANPDDWASWVLYLDCMLPGSAACAAAGGAACAAAGGAACAAAGGPAGPGSGAANGAAAAGAAAAAAMEGLEGGQALRFPVGVVGGMADLWDRRHPWRQRQRQRGSEGDAAAAGPGAQEAAWQVRGPCVQGRPSGLCKCGGLCCLPLGMRAGSRGAEAGSDHSFLLERSDACQLCAAGSCSAGRMQHRQNLVAALVVRPMSSVAPWSSSLVM